MRVLVTGGASGLGRAVAQQVATAGETPLVVDLRPSPDGFGTEVADLADPRAAEAAVQALAREHGGLDAVFTAAGVDSPGPLDKVPAPDWERVVLVNLLGTVTVIRAALPYLRESNGIVITCGSTLGMGVAGGATAYCASKWGVTGFTRALTAELKGQVRVTLLIPGGMDTTFFDGRDGQYLPPDAKPNAPCEVAQAVLFALHQPPGCEMREMVVTSSWEGSWP